MRFFILTSALIVSGCSHKSPATAPPAAPVEAAPSHFKVDAFVDLADHPNAVRAVAEHLQTISEEGSNYLQFGEELSSTGFASWEPSHFKDTRYHWSLRTGQEEESRKYQVTAWFYSYGGIGLAWATIDIAEENQHWKTIWSIDYKPSDSTSP